MTVEITLPQYLQSLAGDKKAVEVGGGTVGECLGDLVGRYPDIKPVLFTKKGKLRSHIEIFVNKKSSYPEELAKPVVEGDKLDIVNIIAGG
jgi:molybdopterin converting factor small subunit